MTFLQSVGFAQESDMYMGAPVELVESAKWRYCQQEVTRPG